MTQSDEDDSLVLISASDIPSDTPQPPVIEKPVPAVVPYLVVGLKKGESTKEVAIARRRLADCSYAKATHVIEEQALDRLPADWFAPLSPDTAPVGDSKTRYWKSSGILEATFSPTGTEVDGQKVEGPFVIDPRSWNELFPQITKLWLSCVVAYKED